MRNSKSYLTVLVSIVVCVMTVYSTVCSEDIKAERQVFTRSALSASSSVSVSVTSTSPSSPAHSEDIKARRPTITGSLYALSALSGKDLSLLAAGEVLMIGQLNRNAQRQILSGAAQALGEEVYPMMVGNIPNAAIRGLSVTPEFALYIEGGGLSDGKVEQYTKFSIITPGLQPSETAFVQALPGEGLRASSVLSYRDTWSAAASDSTYALKPPKTRLVLPKMANPPSIRAIMSGAPKGADDAALTAYLWVRANDLLSPMGDYYLQRAGAPFSIRDFGYPRMMSVRSLPNSVSDWLRALYERRREDMELLPVEKERFLAKSHEPIPDDAQFTVTKDGRTMSAKWSDIGSKFLPAWESLGDAQVRLSVEYGLIVHVMEPVTDDKARALTAKGNVSTEGVKIWIETGERPVEFAPGACPPVHVLSPGKGCGWAFK